jgi:aminoglycoside phosphotransferase (APT) family kinase protein
MRAHVEVELRPYDALLQRGALVLLLDLLIIGMIWTLAAAADGGLSRWVSARRRVWESTLDTIAAIHREPLVDGLRVGLAAELDYWSHYLSWMGESPPALAEAFDWCVAHAPLADEPDPVLLWGDVRFGNIVYDEATLTPNAVRWLWRKSNSAR